MKNNLEKIDLSEEIQISQPSSPQKRVRSISTSSTYNGLNLKDYQLDKTIGSGTFGMVKLGYHIKTNEKVAVKIIDKKNLKLQDDILRLKREIKILKEISHPNIIKVLEVSDRINSCHIVMEYAEGGELFHYITSRKRLAESEASLYFFQIVDALEYLHNKKIVHRDLKPENILFMDSEKRIVKLIDFGLSREFGVRGVMTPCGSPCYAAPEVIKNKAMDYSKVDIWSLGIILFAMTCGYLPFEDMDPQALLKKIISGKVEYPSFIPFTAKDLIKKLLQISPKDRLNIDGIKNHIFYINGKREFERYIGKSNENLKTNYFSNPNSPQIVFQIKDVKDGKENKKKSPIKTHKKTLSYNPQHVTSMIKNLKCPQNKNSIKVDEKLINRLEIRKDEHFPSKTASKNELIIKECIHENLGGQNYETNYDNKFFSKTTKNEKFAKNFKDSIILKEKVKSPHNFSIPLSTKFKFSSFIETRFSISKDKKQRKASISNKLEKLESPRNFILETTESTQIAPLTSREKTQTKSNIVNSLKSKRIFFSPNGVEKKQIRACDIFNNLILSKKPLETELDLAVRKVSSPHKHVSMYSKKLKDLVKGKK
jgi:serine/threonine protein kinase